MLPSTKTVLAIAPVSKTNGATASGIIDTLGAAVVALSVFATTADAVSNKPSVLKLQQGDTTDATAFADISGFIGGTDFTIPNAVTAATAAQQNAYQFNVDMRGRKRYLNLVVSPQTTQTIHAVAVLGRLAEAPINTTKAGVLALVQG